MFVWPILHKTTSSMEDEFKAVGIAGLASLVVLSVVGRRSYQRKILQLTKDLEKQGIAKTSSSPPPKVWAVLTPTETLKVFIVPLCVVMSGTCILGLGVKKWYGIRDLQHGLETIRWVTKTGPRPSQSFN